MAEKVMRVVGTGFEGRDRYIRRFAKSGTKVDLRRAPSNEHDPNAIEVWLECQAFWGLFKAWKPVGFLAKTDAARWAPVIDKGTLRVGGAWVEKVDASGTRSHPWLDVRVRYEIIEGPAQSATALAPPHEWPHTTPLESPQEDLLAYVDNGERVALWRHPDGDVAHVYANGTSFGEGLLGKTRDAQILKQLAASLPVVARVDKTGADVVLKFRLPSKSDLEQEAASAEQALAQKLKKPFRPRKLDAKLWGRAPAGADLQVDDTVAIVPLSAEEFAACGCALTFIAERSDVRIVCRVDEERERIARAAVNGYTVSGTVVKVDSVYGGDRTKIWQELSVHLKVTLTRPK